MGDVQLMSLEIGRLRHMTYCWWTKSCTTKDDDYPIIYRVLTIPGGAGCCPSTECFYKYVYWIYIPPTQDSMVTTKMTIPFWGKESLLKPFTMPPLLAVLRIQDFMSFCGHFLGKDRKALPKCPESKHLQHLLEEDIPLGNLPHVAIPGKPTMKKARVILLKGKETFSLQKRGWVFHLQIFTSKSMEIPTTEALIPRNKLSWIQILSSRPTHHPPLSLDSPICKGPGTAVVLWGERLVAEFPRKKPKVVNQGRLKSRKNLRFFGPRNKNPGEFFVDFFPNA